MKIDVPAISPVALAGTPITPTSPDPTQLTFPPLPPLPPLPPNATMSSRPQTAYEATQLMLQGVHSNGQALPQLPAALRSGNGVSSMRSSKSDGLARNDTLRSHSSQGSNRRASSKVGGGTYYHNSVQFEVAEQAHRVSPNLEVLGEEMGRIRLVHGGGQSPGQHQQLSESPMAGTGGRLAPGMPPSPWAVPRTTAWVTEQAGSSTDGLASLQRSRDSIPEDMVTGGGIQARTRPAATHRYTSDSSIRASSVFDDPASPGTTSGYRTSDTRHSNGEDFSDQHPNRSSSGREHLDGMVVRPGSRMHALAEHDEPILPIQVNTVDPQSFDTGLMLAREDDNPLAGGRSATPIWYTRKANCAIGPESSLYQKGGFCRGALAFRTDGMESGTKSTYDYVSCVIQGRTLFRGVD